MKICCVNSNLFLEIQPNSICNRELICRHQILNRLKFRQFLFSATFIMSFQNFVSRLHPIVFIAVCALAPALMAFSKCQMDLTNFYRRKVRSASELLVKKKIFIASQNVRWMRSKLIKMKRFKPCNFQIMDLCNRLLFFREVVQPIRTHFQHLARAQLKAWRMPFLF